MKRRKFIHLSSSALAISGFESLNPIKDFPTNSNSKLFILATNWGWNDSIEAFAKKIKEEGYDGAELWYPIEKKWRDEIFAAFKNYDLKLGFLIGVGTFNQEEHLSQYTKLLREAATQKDFVPLYINNHSGKDFFKFEINKKIIESSYKIQAESGVPIYHETHRGRICYNAPLTKYYLETIPELRLTLDASHWCNVHESLMEGQEETMALTVSRSEHIHARIGHPQGPQVNDPRAPEWEIAVKTHFGWWDEIVKRKKAKGENITILTEFGPPDYLPALPYTKVPIANQWDINVHMMKVLRERYK